MENLLFSGVLILKHIRVCSVLFSGIASGGGDCRTADQPGLFTAVRQYLDWIKRVIEDAGYSYIY